MHIDKNDWKFFVLNQPDNIDFPTLTTGELFAANISNNLLFKFNNQSQEWEKSIYHYQAIINSSFYAEVDENWNNGYISVKEALNPHSSPLSLINKYPTLFEDQTLEK